MMRFSHRLGTIIFFKSIKNNSKYALMDYGVQINICTFEAN